MAAIIPTSYYLIDADDVAKLRLLSEQLQGGSDRERDYGHRLWLVLHNLVPGDGHDD